MLINIAQHALCGFPCYLWLSEGQFTTEDTEGHRVEDRGNVRI